MTQIEKLTDSRRFELVVAVHLLFPPSFVYYAFQIVAFCGHTGCLDVEQRSLTSFGRSKSLIVLAPQCFQLPDGSKISERAPPFAVSYNLNTKYTKISCVSMFLPIRALFHIPSRSAATRVASTLSNVR
mmetsp:Transcript_17782/g.43900  ORF Transcript_17782/g.43900 Transcript_17782/m.43900 type:complete len:129 (+) Transcript_17782:151-537(+)